MNQRRRPSPAVYRRRQLVAALVAVFLLALIIWGVTGLVGLLAQEEDPSEHQQGTSQTQDNDAAAAPSPQGEPEPETEAEEVPEGQCAPADIEVVASTDKEAYSTDEAPLLVMQITHTGNEACTLDVGTTQQAFRVSREGREIFTTTQCELRGSSLEMEFAPGQIERAQMVWPRSDSAVDCAKPAELTGGEYQLRVSVSGISSEPHAFELAGVTP
ncbi:hypothetical protein M3B43_05385 [Nesterenkonia massiliensis]|uniref:DUF4232 domain-containing protein n=1 Tax=Nesterenkonia massiliensis TaxID=1232429 RepID=A0ABT2HQ12_9MICC|nr:hypothetical protein [Nesterenkonia massiliensis]MCT1606766.1 hypothetical protein [Nesterenkonia massiliensis]